MTDETTEQNEPTEAVAATEAPTETSGTPSETPKTTETTESKEPTAPVETTDEVQAAESPAEEAGGEADKTSAAPAPAPSPAAALPGAIPSPAALASRMAARPAPPVVAPTPAPSESARFGRVDDEGRVFVTVGEEEREVGSYPGATPDEALQYFARKYDELFSQAELLAARLEIPEVSAKEIGDGLATLKEHLADAKVVGDLTALEERVTGLESALAAKREQESAQRAQARAAAITEREALVAAAEKIAATPPASVQWKRSGEQMRELLDQWKQHQRSGPKIDKPTENALWQRFSHARNSFDKARKSHFAHLDETRGQAKATKEKLADQAEQLATSKDWAPTARAFKDLMDQWRRAGRASRGDDDALWERFKTAQDAFFAAKDEVVAAEDEEFRANLTVKEALLAEAEALLPLTDLEAAKASLRTIQDKWDKAGKVPRSDMERIERGLRRVESAVREAEDKKWKASNPEVAARANSMVTQLESSIAALRDDLATAESRGNDKKVRDLGAKIEAQEQWLAQAKAGLAEFGS